MRHQSPDRQLVMHLVLIVIRPRLQEVDLNEGRSRFHLAEKGERLGNMLDHVKGKCRVKSARDILVKVIDRRSKPTTGQAPSQVLGTGIVKVGKRDVIPRFKE